MPHTQGGPQLRQADTLCVRAVCDAGGILVNDFRICLLEGDLATRSTVYNLGCQLIMKQGSIIAVVYSFGDAIVSSSLLLLLLLLLLLSMPPMGRIYCQGAEVVDEATWIAAKVSGR